MAQPDAVPAPAAAVAACSSRGAAPPVVPGPGGRLADSWLEIDGEAIAANLRALARRLTAGTELCPVVKCDGYGLGALPVTRLMARHGIERVVVFRAAEAAELLQDDGPGPRVLLVMPLRAEIARAIRRGGGDVLALRRGLERGRLSLTVHDEDDVDRASDLAVALRRPVAVHLFLDTGMHRGGAAPARATALARHVRRREGLVLEGLATHLASPEAPDDDADRQVALFDRVEQAVTAESGVPPLRHVASTFGVLRRRSLHRELVRVGLAWTGHGPAWMRVPHAPIELRPCVRWLSRVSEVIDVAAGERAGYGGAWTARTDTRLALVPVGYGDGLPPGLGADDVARERGRVVLVRPDGTRAVAGIVGRVNMDQIMVDVGPLEAAAPVRRGDAVEVLGGGPGAPHGVDAHARAAGVPPHAVLCSISPRVPRRYLGFDLAPALVEPATPGLPVVADADALATALAEPDPSAVVPSPESRP